MPGREFVHDVRGERLPGQVTPPPYSALYTLLLLYSASQASRPALHYATKVHRLVTDMTCVTAPDCSSDLHARLVEPESRLHAQHAKLCFGTM